MQLARIFAQIALATAELAAALGFKGLRQFPVGAPVILFGAAGLVVVSAIMWGLEAFAGGDATYRKRFGNLWGESRETIKSILAGKAKESTKYSVKGAVLSIVAAFSALALAVSPAGWVATGITVLAEIMFIAAAYCWYASAKNEYHERYTKGLEAYKAEQAQLNGLDLNDEATVLSLERQFASTPSLAIIHAHTDGFYNKYAAGLAGVAVATAFIPLVGPAVAAGFALMSGFSWMRGYFAGKAYKAELAETQAVKVEKVKAAPVSVISGKEAGETVKISPAPNSSATSSPVLRQSAMRKSVEVDPAMDKAHEEIAAKLSRSKRAA